MSDENATAPPAPVSLWPQLDAASVLTGWSREPIAGMPAIPEADAPQPFTVRWQSSLLAFEPILFAYVDDESVLLRLDGRWAEGAIAVPANCDLVPGQWRFDRATDTWKALPKLLRGKPRNIIALEMLATKAFALALRAMRDGEAMPQYTLDWLAEWEKTIDAGSVAQGVAQNLSRDRRGGRDDAS
jgi:hypothetical protein